MDSETRVALIGCGGFAGAHIRRLRQREDARIAALCSRTQASIDALVARKLGDWASPPPAYTDPQRMLDQVQPDLVIIATPHDLHAAHARMALEAGAHVLIEKPMVSQTEEAAELNRLAHRQGRSIGVAFNPPHSAPFARVRELLRAGELGELQMISGTLLQNWMEPTAGSWRQDAGRSGGGQLADSGSHLISSVATLVPELPVEVYAQVNTCGTPVPVDATVQLRYASGLLVSLSIGGRAVYDQSWMQVVGSQGRVELDGWNGQWARGRAARGPLADLDLRTDAEPDPVHAMLEHLHGSAALPCDGTDGQRVTALLAAMRASAQRGQPVSPTEVEQGGAAHA